MAMTMPETKPGVEVRLFQAERDMARRHAAAVKRGAAGEAGPEVRDFFEMRRPVLDLRGEDRADSVVLAHIGIETPQQKLEPGASADSFVERCRGIHVFGYQQSAKEPARPGRKTAGPGNRA